ncbi:DUF4345 domain-containing protein [Leptospira idonii]|uniref:DUF4345 domain-containing protein n=1 Tax=Leptospira idonii TaxID=1193500 RepID=A0A4V3JXW5_9LEPT|nr:DUF4345 domain-containing protein [Leptospira idonii]TGN18456.1 DUF4345 domain-containing protein [Leptospira idonii]
MNSQSTVSISTRIVQVCLFLAAAIALFGGSVQMYLGEPDVSPRLDNIHRFMAGLYLSMGIICFWAAYTIQTQKTLVYLIALAIFVAAVGRLISMSIVGLPEPHGLWLGYLGAELILPILMAGGQLKRK